MSSSVLIPTAPRRLASPIVKSKSDGPTLLRHRSRWSLFSQIRHPRKRLVGVLREPKLPLHVPGPAVLVRVHLRSEGAGSATAARKETHAHNGGARLGHKISTTARRATPLAETRRFTGHRGRGAHIAETIVDEVAEQTYGGGEEGEGAE